MRAFLILLLSCTATLSAQTPSALARTPYQTQAAITQALLGRWTGVLEYRDYSEPVTSTRRVQLPTWLEIHASPDGLSANYVYDDGPTKTVIERSTIVLDVAARTYTAINSDKTVQTFSLTGLDQLEEGRGTLTLTRPGTDNDHPAEIRTTWTVRRNLLSWLEEVRPAGSTGAFVFRHRYTFTRADLPSVSAVTPAK